ncbi:hypothetical protein [Fulvivirga ligni]|uniref:hypothetical protein n=1 Tax=Fulvivirga ligni TaxID=2904246 RepID=UPI001F48B41B|nr:hypothetical protein [Fulvivirga ligni]UII19306.1 hypothetical protein LVD16_15790 [Fulvivirga ligni]
MNKYIALCCIIMAVVSCKPETDSLEKAVENYKTEHPEMDLEFTSSNQNMKLLGNSSDLNMALMVQSSKDLSQKYMEMTLQPDGGNIATPTRITTDSMAENAFRHTIIFEPIHDRSFYYKTGEKGNIQQKYKAIISGQETTFNMDSIHRSSYIQKTSRNRQVIYLPKLNKEAQMTYQDSMGMTDFVYQSDNEITLAGINFISKVFTKDDITHMKVRIINRSQTMIQVSSPLIMVATQPEISSVEDFETITIAPGNRLESNFTFHLSTNTEKFSLSKKLITIRNTDTYIPLLRENLIFERE